MRHLRAARLVCALSASCALALALGCGREPARQAQTEPKSADRSPAFREKDSRLPREKDGGPERRVDEGPGFRAPGGRFGENDAPPPEAAPNTEQYAHRVDNSFQDATRAPLSTLSVDADTASYSNVRRFLTQEGRLPPADAVKIEALMNYFPYNYPRPRDGKPVTFSLDVADCPWQPKHQLARVAVAARVLEAGDLPPRNFVFLVDTSGSMDPPNRLPLLKASLNLLVDRMTARDRVALVAYAGSAGLVLPPTPGDQKQAVRDALERLKAGGSTAGGAGLALAYQVARDGFLKGGINRVIIGTDGDFNVGASSQGELVRQIEKERASGVFLSVLGFGMGNVKDSTLEKLAYHGNGHHAYIDSLDEAKKVFVEQGAALVTVAKDVKLQVEFNPKKVGAYRLLGYENRVLAARDFNDDSKHAVAMGMGHTVTALYELVPPGLPVPRPAGVDALKYQEAPKGTPAADADEWFTVKLRYKDPEAETSQLLSKSLTGPAAKLADAPADFRFVSAVAGFGLLLRDSPYKGEARYETVRTLAAGALGDDPGGYRAGFLDLVKTAERLTPRPPGK